MDRKIPDHDFTLRQFLKQRVTQGGPKGEAAQQRLDGPDFPDVMMYLFIWASELVGRSGVGMDGSAPLSYREIAAWAAFTGRHPQPHEVRALIKLDRVIRHPELKDPDEEDA